MRHRDGERPIPNYKREACLGEGGYGEVWKATGPGGVPCALKFIKLDSNAGLKELKSIGLVKRLRHPHLVPISAVWLRDEDGNLMTEGDNGESLSFRVYGDKELVIAMGLGSGSLADRLAAARAERAADALPGGLSLRRLLGYMADAAKGIDCLNDPPAHDNAGIKPLAHCDIKPANLLLVGGGVQVCDYGVARAVGKDIKKTMAAGTAAYAAPELINNDPGLKSDQYSLAISYYELRTGRLPLDENKAMMAHLMGMLDFSGVAPEEAEVLQQATAMKVGERFPTCEEFVDALHVATGRTVVSAPSGPRSHPPVRRLGGATEAHIDLPPDPADPPVAVAAARPTSEVLRPSGAPVAGYVLDKLLGQGGYGQVWQAADEDGVACALKILRDVQGKGRHEYETLVRLRKLDHPNLLRLEKLWVLDEYWAHIPAEQLGRADGREARRLVIRTPLADKNLFQRLTECRRQNQPGIPPAELLRHLRQAADALDYLNIDQQTQHRDVKPENLLLKGEAVWVSDFGLAKVVPPGGTAAQSTSSGMTQEYASPEVLTNKQVTARSDQYSLGVTYHVLRTGRLPFPPGLSMLDLIRARASASLDLTALTEAERPVLRRALSARPGDRYATCRELVRELGQALGMTSTGQLSALPVEPAARRTPTPAAKSGPPATITFPPPDTDIEYHDPGDGSAEAESLPAPASWRSPDPARAKSGPVRPRPAAGFAEDKPRSNRLLVGGLAAAAAVGLAVGAAFVLRPDGDVVVGPTPPTGPQPVVTPPTSTGGDPATRPGLDEERQKLPKAPADRLERLAALAKSPDASDEVRKWAADRAGEWRPVVAKLNAPAPSGGGFDALFAHLDDAHPRAADRAAEEERALVEQALRAELGRRAEMVVRRLDEVPEAGWGRLREVLVVIPDHPWAAAGHAEAELAAGKPVEWTRAEPAGIADYLAALAGWAADPAQAADRLAAVPLADADWLTPRRAAVAADRLAKAAAAGEPADRRANWLLAADRAAGRAGLAGEEVRRKLAADTVLVLGDRADAKEVATAAADRLTEATFQGLTADDQARVRKVAGQLGVPLPFARLAELAELRRRLADADKSPEEFAKSVLPKLADPAALLGPNPSAESKREAAALLSAAGRLVVRNRDRWAGKGGFGSATENAQRAADLFRRSAELGGRAEDAGLRRVAEYLGTGRVGPLPAGAGGGSPAELVVRALAAGQAPDRATAQAAWAAAVAGGRADPDRHRAELEVAYRRGGEHAILYAHEDPARQRELLDTAVEWGAALTKLDPDRADGPNVEGCAREDLGWLARTPADPAERTGPGGPYAQADRCFQAGEKCKYGDRGYATVHRGRNLFKWAEDEAQLGKYRALPTDKAAPDEARLRAAEAALKAAGDTAEAVYWRAEVAALRYDAAAGRLVAAEPAPIADAAIKGFRRVPTLPGVTADWKRDADKRLGELYRAEAGRLAKAGKPAEAVVMAEAAGFAPADLAKLHAEAGQGHLAAGGVGAEKAAKALERALELDPASPDRWRWRFDLGRAEHLLAGRSAGAAALSAHARAVNHLRAFLFDGFALASAPAAQAEYAEKTGLMKQFMAAAGEQFDKQLKKPPAGPLAVWQLARLEKGVDDDPDAAKKPENGGGIPAATRAEAERLLQEVERSGAGSDRKLVAAAQEMAARVRKYPPKKQ